MDKKPSGPKRKSGKGNNRNAKNIGFIALIVLFGLIIVAATNQPSTMKNVPITQAVQDANAGKYEEITVVGNQLKITKKGESKPSLKTYLEPNATLKDEGFNYDKVEIHTTANNNGNSTWVAIGTSIIPVIIIAGVLYFMLRSAQGQGNQAMSFGKSKARLYGNEKDKVTF